jgi:inorganic phosphate transporter, PiT family
VTITVIVVVAVLILCLVFTYTNGFQDGSSVTACAIASRAMTPLQAVYLVASFELLGAMLGGSAVATTIRNITSWPDQPDLLPVLASGLIAAIFWNFATRRMRIPSSSTHALVGGVLGALYAAAGSRFIVMGNADILHPSGVWKVIITLFASPVIGFVAGYLLLKVALVLLSRASTKVNKPIKSLHWLTTAVLAFGHGSNDPQKSMGIIMLCLHAAGMHEEGIPFYVRLATGLTIALGVVGLAPGIVKRVGSGIYRMKNLDGFVSELSSGSVVLVGSLTGGPVSASQVISSTVMGVGAANRAKGVQWLAAKELLVAWFMTIPCSAMLAYSVHGLFLRHLDHYLH